LISLRNQHPEHGISGHGYRGFALAWSTTATVTSKLQKGPYSRQLFPWTAIESKMLELVLHSFVGCFQLNLRIG
jgi:hypothetical protein